MNKVRKMLFAVVALWVMATGTAFAQQDTICFRSSETGICVTIPQDMKIVKHDETILHLSTPTMVFSAHPMLTEKLTSAAVRDMVISTAKSVGLTLDKMKQYELDHSSLIGHFYTGQTDGVNFAVGLLEPKENKKVAFLFTLTFAPSDNDAATTLLDSLQFDPDAIQ